jgi:hypothetical protein
MALFLNSTAMAEAYESDEGAGKGEEIKELGLRISPLTPDEVNTMEKHDILDLAHLQ